MPLEGQAVSLYHPEFKPMKKDTMPSGVGPRDLAPRKKTISAQEKKKLQRDIIAERIREEGRPLTQAEVFSYEELDYVSQSARNSRLCGGISSGRLKRRNRVIGNCWEYWVCDRPWPDEIDDVNKPEQVKYSSLTVDAGPFNHAPPTDAPVCTAPGAELHDATPVPEDCGTVGDVILERIVSRSRLVVGDFSRDARRLRALADWDDVDSDIALWLITLAAKLEGFA